MSKKTPMVVKNLIRQNPRKLRDRIFRGIEHDYLTYVEKHGARERYKPGYVRALERLVKAEFSAQFNGGTTVNDEFLSTGGIIAEYFKEEALEHFNFGTYPYRKQIKSIVKKDIREWLQGEAFKDTWISQLVSSFETNRDGNPSTAGQWITCVTNAVRIPLRAILTTTLCDACQNFLFCSTNGNDGILFQLARGKCPEELLVAVNVASNMVQNMVSELRVIRNPNDQLLYSQAVLGEYNDSDQSDLIEYSCKPQPLMLNGDTISRESDDIVGVPPRSRPAAARVFKDSDDDDDNSSQQDPLSVRRRRIDSSDEDDSGASPVVTPPGRSVDSMPLVEPQEDLFHSYVDGDGFSPDARVEVYEFDSQEDPETPSMSVIESPQMDELPTLRSVPETPPRPSRQSFSEFSPSKRLKTSHRPFSTAFGSDVSRASPPPRRGSNPFAFDGVLPSQSSDQSGRDSPPGRTVGQSPVHASVDDEDPTSGTEGVNHTQKMWPSCEWYTHPNSGCSEEDLELVRDFIGEKVLGLVPETRKLYPWIKKEEGPTKNWEKFESGRQLFLEAFMTWFRLAYGFKTTHQFNNRSIEVLRGFWWTPIEFFVDYDQFVLCFGGIRRTVGYVSRQL